MPSHSRCRPSGPGRRFALGALTLIIAGCGGESSTDPGDRSPLRLVTADIRPSTVVSANVRGVVVPGATIAGELGGSAITAGRVNDTTIAFMVPATMTADVHPLRLDVAGRVLTAQVTVAAPVALADPGAYVDSTFARIERALALTDSAVYGMSGADTAGIRRNGQAVRDALAALRQEYEAASPADQAAMAAALAANPHVVATSAAAAPAARVVHAGATFASFAPLAPVDATALALGDRVCTDGQQCVTRLSLYLDGFATSALTLAGVKIGVDIAASAGGGLVGRWLAGITGAAAVGAFLYNHNAIVIDEFLTPMIGSVVAGDDELRGAVASVVQVGGAPASAQGPVTAGRPAAVTVLADYRTLTASDLTTLPGAAALASAYASFQESWRRLATYVPLFDLPAPSLGVQPARTARVAVPPAQLALGAVSPAPWTGTAAASGDLWLVTLANPQAGSNHDVTFGIRYRPPGYAEQATTRTVTVFPAAYAVKSIAITPAEPRVERNATLALVAELRDSADALITTLRPTWSSADMARATVDTLGVVTGRDTGSVTITAAAGGKQAQVTLRVTGPEWKVIELPSLGGRDAEGLAINDSGWVTGYSATATDTNPHAVLWKGSQVTDLGTGTGWRAMGLGINNLGHVVGSVRHFDQNASRSYRERGFVWRGGTMQTLEGLYNPAVDTAGEATARAINDGGTIVGGGAWGNWVESYRPVRWTTGSRAEALARPDSTTRPLPYIITPTGTIVGRDSDGETWVWTGGVPQRLEPAGIVTNVVDANASGHLAGTIGTPWNGDTVRVAIWVNGRRTELPMDDVYGITDDGRVIGQRYASRTLVMWDNGTVTTLLDLSSYPELYIYDVNGRGQITGSYRPWASGRVPIVITR